MRVLLTGSSGWLGRVLALMLRQAGHAVIGLDVAPGLDTRVIGSVADRRIVDVAFANHGIEAVIHAGALHKPDIARYPRQAFVDVNVTGTLNLLEAAVRAGQARRYRSRMTRPMCRPHWPGAPVEIRHPGLVAGSHRSTRVIARASA